MEDRRNYKNICPIFIVLGFPKCATTWIHRQLESHPAVGCTKTKEINYWTKSYEKGSSWYTQQFPNDKSYKVFAEVCPHYVYKEAITRIIENLSEFDVRFGISLRNPYERTFSHYWDVLRSGRAQGSIESVIHRVPPVIEQSLYGSKLKMAGEYLSLNELFVCQFERINSDPGYVVEELFQFIDVDPNHKSGNLTQKVNAGRKATHLDMSLKKLEMFTKRCGLKREHLLRFGLWSYFEKMNHSLSKKRPIPKMDASDKRFLESTLNPEIELLEDLLNISFQHWKD